MLNVLKKLWTELFVAVLLVVPTFFVAFGVSAAKPDCLACWADVVLTFWCMGVIAHGPIVWITNSLTFSRRLGIWLWAMGVGFATYLGVEVLASSLFVSGHMWEAVPLGFAAGLIGTTVALAVSGVLVRRSARRGQVSAPPAVIRSPIRNREMQIPDRLARATEQQGAQKTTIRMVREAVWFGGCVVVAGIFVVLVMTIGARPDLGDDQHKQQSATAPIAAPAPNRFEETLRQQNRDAETRLRGTTIQSTDTTPQRAADVLKLSRQTGIPADVIDRNYDQILKNATAHGVIPSQLVVDQTPDPATLDAYAAASDRLAAQTPSRAPTNLGAMWIGLALVTFGAVTAVRTAWWLIRGGGRRFRYWSDGALIAGVCLLAYGGLGTINPGPEMDRDRFLATIGAGLTITGALIRRRRVPQAVSPAPTAR